MSTQVQLFSTPLSLVSIPREAYPVFCQGVLKLILGTWKDDLFVFDFERPNAMASALSSYTSLSRRSSHHEDNLNSTSTTPTQESPGTLEDKYEELLQFINVSLTPIECSVILPSELVDVIFGDELRQFGEMMKVETLRDTYLAIQVDTDGMDTGSRVLTVTTPLSVAGVSIFFLSTYFSDYVLVPIEAKTRVIKALEDRGFSFSNLANSYISLADPSDLHRPPTSSRSAYSAGLTERTFDLFKQSGVSPVVDSAVKLLLTGARSHDSDAINLAVTKILLQPPKYFSVTISSGSELSFLVDKHTAKRFPHDALLGSPTDYVIPVSLDLRGLPEDSTGIVSGVAGRLMGRKGDGIHMGYWSTAKSGVVLVNEDNASIAIQELALPLQDSDQN
ncbi:hypothetical protein TRVA0_053S00738 [Trichomonascus vanleenenianus]|uniref:ACT domain-containing protein n=1 Tax=Trichomonascus vanleenenianus TaxID=2268995 RepID=UPI003ECA5CA8